MPAVLILAVYAARFGIAAGWGRSQAIPIVALLVLVMLAVLPGNPFRRNP